MKEPVRFVVDFSKIPFFLPLDVGGWACKGRRPETWVNYRSFPKECS